MSTFTHFDAQGQAHMVDVADKASTRRIAIATGCILYVIITTLGPISGAHFNPVVTVAFALRGEHAWGGVAPYIIAQIIGGILGVWAAHQMFDLTILQTSTTLRTGINQWSSEIIATFGLLFVIFGGVKTGFSLIMSGHHCGGNS